MSKNQARIIADRYLSRLASRRIPVTRAYLFGSQVRGNARKDSDIDIAIISPWFNAEDDAKRVQLWTVRTPEEYDIEPHGFSPQDFEDNADPMVYEIKKTGERIV